MKRRKKQNRKKVSDISFPCPLAALLIVVGLLSLVYLWFSGRCDAIGEQITLLEKQKLEVHRRVLNEEYKWCKKKSPQSIEQLLRHHNLSMISPKEKKIVRVSEEPKQSLAEEAHSFTPQVAQVVKRRYE